MIALSFVMLYRRLSKLLLELFCESFPVIFYLILLHLRWQLFCFVTDRVLLHLYCSVFSPSAMKSWTVLNSSKTPCCRKGSRDPEDARLFSKL